MTKYTLIGLLAVCATVLCFSLIFRERLCELNIHRGNDEDGITQAQMLEWLIESEVKRRKSL